LREDGPRVADFEGIGTKQKQGAGVANSRFIQTDASQSGQLRHGMVQKTYGWPKWMLRSVKASCRLIADWKNSDACETKSCACIIRVANAKTIWKPFRETAVHDQ
jgi:hypothetical protein